MDVNPQSRDTAVLLWSNRYMFVTPTSLLSKGIRGLGFNAQTFYLAKGQVDARITTFIHGNYVETWKMVYSPADCFIHLASDSFFFIMFMRVVWIYWGCDRN